jgi:rod shape determining protein RodA
MDIKILSPLGLLKRLFSSLDQPLLIITGLLVFAGLITIYSATLDMPDRMYEQLRNIGFAFILMWLISRIPPQILMRIAVPIYTIGLGLLIAVAMFGLIRKGARRWLNIGIVVQPSEIMKIAMPLMLAWYFQKKEGITKIRDYLFAFLLLALPVGLIARQPDLGTALLVLASGIYVIFFAGLSWRIIVPILTIGIVGIILLLIFGSSICAAPGDWLFLHDYQKHRICTLLDPTTDPLGKGFHTIQSVIAIGSGGLFGKGWLKGTQSHLEFIPEKHTDFIFAVYAEEFGLIGNVILLILFIALIFRGLTIALQAATLFDRLLAGAITLMFFTYGFVNMAMVSGLLPVVGVPLPLFSYGGTTIVTQGLGLGILFNVARNRRLVQT